MWGPRRWAYRQDDIPATRPEEPGDLYLSILSKQGSPEHLRALAWSLGRLPDLARAMEMALRLARDPDPYVRELGVVALIELHAQGMRDADRALVCLVTDPAERVKAAIPRELRYQDTHEATDIILKLVSDSSPHVREQVAKALHVHAHPEAKRCYLDLLKDPEPRVRAAAVNNCSPINDGLKEPWLEVFALQRDPSEEVRANLPMWVCELPAHERDARLIAMSRDSSPLVRASSVYSMRDHGSPRILARLLECLRDPHDQVRMGAAEHISRWSGDDPEDSITPALLRCARDSNPTVRKFAAQGLETRAMDSMLPTLERLAEDEDHMYIRLAAARALGKLRGPEAEVILSGMLKDPAKLVQKTARRILEQWSKLDPIGRDSEFQLRYGPKEAKATRESFNVTSKKPMKEWERFMELTRTMDGAPSGDTNQRPAIVISSETGTTWGLIPFGPAHWIRLEHIQQNAAPPQLGYALLSNQEVGAWMKGAKPGRVQKGRKIVQRYEWE